MSAFQRCECANGVYCWRHAPTGMENAKPYTPNPWLNITSAVHLLKEIDDEAILAVSEDRKQRIKAEKAVDEAFEKRTW